MTITSGPAASRATAALLVCPSDSFNTRCGGHAAIIVWPDAGSRSSRATHRTRRATARP